MKLCGLTGGVGMGKSTAAGFFLELGARLVDTDDLAHELVEPGQPALAEIQEAFGRDIVGPDGRLKRKELARQVFSDTQARKKLEAILHPRIRERWQAQIEIWRKEGCAVAVVVIPLLYETAAELNFDKVVCVACSAAGQHERLQGRGWPMEQVEGRIKAQWAIEQKMARANYIIWTDGSLASHRRQVREVFQRL